MKKSANPEIRWLFKEEPTHYNLLQLEADSTTLWDGVDNNLARKHLRNCKIGDLVLYYHTGKEKSIVGEMRVVSDPRPDPISKDPKSVVVKVEFVCRWENPVTLVQIKRDPALADWDLVRISRLSVVPVSAEQLQRLQKLRGA